MTLVLKDVRPIIAELVRLKKSIPLEIDVGRYLPEIRKNTHGEAVRGGIKKALRAIEQAPTIDAVEVVRCKDCKLRYSNDCAMAHSEYFYDEDDRGDYRVNEWTADDGFCNAGERWEDNG